MVMMRRRRYHWVHFVGEGLQNEVLVLRDAVHIELPVADLGGRKPAR